MSEEKNHFVAVIGAGPAGLFGARELAVGGAQVVLFNRDIKPGGLAEYGIYPDKHTMKGGLRKQFHQVLDNQNITYYGNVKIGAQGDLSLDDLRCLGFQALLVTAGAQGTKWLGLPGENLRGVYHAKDVVYYYNRLPPYSQWAFHFGKRCAIIGAGNVMVDIARFLIREKKVDEVISVVRRGPGEVNFTKEEMKHIVANLDLAAFETELRRVLPALEAVSETSDVGRQKVLDALPKADPKFADTRFRFEFLTSPVGMLGEDGVLTGLEVEDNILVQKDGDLKARGTGHRRVIAVDTVIFAIGDRVDASVGLPVASNEFIKNPAPRFPVESTSYEAFDPTSNAPIADVFVGGWSRQASEGLVGVARKDGTNAARAVQQYLQTLPTAMPNLDEVGKKMKSLGKPIITKDELHRLESMEAAEAQKRGAEEFKFASNEEMLQALGLEETAVNSAH
ncbi:MAG TPA: FAD-dependent oxidoreductase [Anaerolineales bacterium]|nr:FAD-dependent oxidoreductase [Anaerolineales bacterium]